MKKTIKFWTIAIWILLTRSYDVYATSQFTPNLDRESNPLVSVFGINNWTFLITIVSILTIYIIYTLYINTFKNNKFLPKEKGLNFIDFMTYTYFGKKEKWTGLFYKFTKMDRMNYFMGYILSRSFVIIGFISTIMWVLINYTKVYYPDYHKTGLIYGLLILTVFFIWIFYFKKLYKVYKTIKN